MKKCFPYIIFYSFGVFGIYPYETYKTLCITQGKSFILLIGSTVGVIVRLLICVLFINTSFALLVFGIVLLLIIKAIRLNLRIGAVLFFFHNKFHSY